MDLINELRDHLDDIERRQKQKGEKGEPEEPAGRFESLSPQGTPARRARTLTPGDGCERQSARAALEGLIVRLEDRAHCLRKLAEALPLVLPAPADEALWDLIGRVGY